MNIFLQLFQRVAAGELRARMVTVDTKVLCERNAVLATAHIVRDIMGPEPCDDEVRARARILAAALHLAHFDSALSAHVDEHHDALPRGIVAPDKVHPPQLKLVLHRQVWVVPVCDRDHEEVAGRDVAEAFASALGELDAACESRVRERRVVVAHPVHHVRPCPGIPRELGSATPRCAIDFARVLVAVVPRGPLAFCRLYTATIWVSRRAHSYILRDTYTICVAEATCASVQLGPRILREASHLVAVVALRVSM